VRHACGGRGARRCGRPRFRQVRTPGATFDEAAELYDRARPVSPAQVFADLAELAELPPRARLVETGCGTGEATQPLAQCGYAVTCVELGEQVAAVERRNAAEFSDVDVVAANFETWRPARAGYDGVVAFGAFHCDLARPALPQGR
jgi:protein-L-isoaspartate O-methyltransferase